MTNKTLTDGSEENFFCMKCPGCKAEIQIAFSKIKKVISEAEGPCDLYKKIMRRMRYPTWKRGENEAIALSASLYLRELRKANYGRK